MHGIGRPSAIAHREDYRGSSPHNITAGLDAWYIGGPGLLIDHDVVTFVKSQIGRGFGSNYMM